MLWGTQGGPEVKQGGFQPVPSARILLVEDDPFIRELLLETLLDADFEVIEAGNGEEAVAMLDQNAFALLLTDVHIPGPFNGVDVARYARAQQPDLPVVFATGRPEVLSSFGELGAREVCLVKPFAPSEALETIKTLLQRCAVQSNSRAADKASASLATCRR